MSDEKKCACRHPEPFECAKLRYGASDLANLEECDCLCHEPEEDEDTCIHGNYVFGSCDRCDYERRVYREVYGNNG